MSDRMTSAELADIANVYAALPLMHPELLAAERSASRVFADQLRKDIGLDVDDVTLGRILLHIGSFVGRVAHTPETATLGNTFILAALDMTALERGEMPPS